MQSLKNSFLLLIGQEKQTNQAKYKWPNKN